MVLAITPRTDRGSGLMLPITKGIARLLVVFNAISREWPITREEAAQELREANEHFQSAIVSQILLSDDAYTTLSEWKNAINDLTNELVASATAEPEEPMPEASKAAIRTLSEQSWSLLTIMDRELTGLGDDQTDPGRLP